MYDSATVRGQTYRSLALVFYRVPPDEESYVNRAAACLSGNDGMSHVELRFRNGESVSIFQQETVFLKKRGYSNPNYRIVDLNVSVSSEKQMYSFARAQVGKEFNKTGLYLALLPWPLRPASTGHAKNGRWFCSELIVKTLQQGGMLTSADPSAASPNSIYRSVRGSIAGRTWGLNAAISASRLAMQNKVSQLQFVGRFFEPEGQATESERKKLLKPQGPAVPVLDAALVSE